MASKGLPRAYIWLGLIFASWAAVALIGWVAYSIFTRPQPAIALLEPPAVYAHEPRQRYTVTVTADHMELVRRCRMGFHAHLVGCALPRKNEIYIIAGLSDEDFATVLRHEKAHLNGWRH